VKSWLGERKLNVFVIIGSWLGSVHVVEVENAHRGRSGKGTLDSTTSWSENDKSGGIGMRSQLLDQIVGLSESYLEEL
jgi:hypothetical protein